MGFVFVISSPYIYKYVFAMAFENILLKIFPLLHAIVGFQSFLSLK